MKALALIALGLTVIAGRSDVVLDGGGGVLEPQSAVVPAFRPARPADGRAEARHYLSGPQPTQLNSGSRPHPTREPSYLLMDAVTGRLLDARWDDPGHPLPMGSLIKPFTALAYAATHRYVFPAFVCRGSIDGCWLPAGHGRLGIAAAIAGSCNAYFHQLSERTPPEALVSTLRWLGVRPFAEEVTPASMVGLGEGLQLTPVAIAHGYLELVARATHPGVAPIVQGMAMSARSGTGRAVGAAMGQARALAKTGTAPCGHSPRASGDGYAIVVYPADRPRVALLVQAHGRTGAETAALAAELLRRAVEVR